jgi:hypothetical protein
MCVSCNTGWVPLWSLYALNGMISLALTILTISLPQSDGPCRLLIKLPIAMADFPQYRGE